MCRTGLEGGKGERFYFPGLASICKCSDISPLFLSSHLGKMMNKDHVSPTNAGILLPVSRKRAAPFARRTERERSTSRGVKNIKAN